jgi:hypothetical protein
MDGDLSPSFQHCRATDAQMNKGFFPLPVSDSQVNLANCSPKAVAIVNGS